MRIRSKWNARSKARSLEEVAGALAFIEWRIAGQTLLNLENEGFQTDTQGQRLDVLQELCAFLIHVTDRMTHESMDEEERQRFIVALALKTADHYHDNRIDTEGDQDFRRAFIDTLNLRMADYAEFRFVDGEPGYSSRRYLGDRITNTMGERDRKWISSQVMDIEIPDMLVTLKKGLTDLFVFGTEESESRRGGEATTQSS